MVLVEIHWKCVEALYDVGMWGWRVKTNQRRCVDVRAKINQMGCGDGGAQPIRGDIGMEGYNQSHEMWGWKVTTN